MTNIITKTRHKSADNIRLFAITLIAIVFLTINPISSAAQDGSPPPPPNQHGQNGNQTAGGSASIGSGMIMLIALGAAYGAKKVYGYRKRKLAG